MLPHMDKIEEGQGFGKEASLKPISVKQVWDDGDLNEQSDRGLLRVAGVGSQDRKRFLGSWQS